MKIMRVLLVFLLLGAATPALPQTAWPVASLTVQGNRNYRTADILKVAGLRVGSTAGAKEFEAARDRLLATGLFESVGYRFGPSPSDPSRFAAVFEVREIEQVYPLRTEELPVSQEAVENWLRAREPLYGEKVPGTDVVLKRYAQHVEELLTKEGKPVKVSARLTPEGGDLVVMLRPANLPAVAEIHFKGNKSIDSQTLQRAVTGAGIGALFTERRFQQVLEHSIRPLYEAQGQIRVSFPKLETGPAKSVDGIAVNVTVDEGPVYTLGRVEAGGVDNAAALVKQGGFKPGEPADFTAIEEGVGKMLRELRRTGYVKAAAQTERTVRDREKEVDLLFRIDPGPRFTMGNLKIEGLDIQTEPYVRKLWALKPGAPFNGEYPEFFLNRLREDGIFENLGETRYEVKLDDKSLVADVRLTFGKGTDLPAIGPDAPTPRP